jgi:hypothetical protein
MKALAAVFVVLLAVFPLVSQTVVSPYRALHPIMPNGNQRNAPSSVSASDLGPDPSPPPPSGSNRTAQPVVATKVDVCLQASRLTVVATIDGIRGKLSVTNRSSAPVTPMAQFEVRNPTGGKVGTVSKIGEALAAGADEELEILATNLNASDLRLLKLTVAQTK